MERVMASTNATLGRNTARHGRTQSLEMKQSVEDPDKVRSSHVKMLVADRLKEEQIRNKLITDEIVKLKHSGPRASSA